MGAASAVLQRAAAAVAGAGTAKETAAGAARPITPPPAAEQQVQAGSPPTTPVDPPTPTALSEEAPDVPTSPTRGTDVASADGADQEENQQSPENQEAGDEEDEEEEEPVTAGEGLLPPIPGRRCANCNTQTTPLWRNGPLGAKTLCNACGVRDNRRRSRSLAQRARARKQAAAAQNAAGMTAEDRQLRKARAAAAKASREAAAAQLAANAAGAALSKRSRSTRRAAQLSMAKPQQPQPAVAPPADCAVAFCLPPMTIDTPTFANAVPQGYDAFAQVPFVATPVELVPVPRDAASLWGVNASAPHYKLDEVDAYWLAQANAAVAEAPSDGQGLLTEMQLEKLMDVFEMATWERGTPISVEDAIQMAVLPGDVSDAALCSRVPSSSAVVCAHKHWLRRRQIKGGALTQRFEVSPAAGARHADQQFFPTFTYPAEFVDRVNASHAAATPFASAQQQLHPHAQHQQPAKRKRNRSGERSGKRRRPAASAADAAATAAEQAAALSAATADFEASSVGSDIASERGGATEAASVLDDMLLPPADDDLLALACGAPGEDFGLDMFLGLPPSTSCPAALNLGMDAADATTPRKRRTPRALQRAHSFARVDAAPGAIFPDLLDAQDAVLGF